MLSVISACLVKPAHDLYISHSSPDSLAAMTVDPKDGHPHLLLGRTARSVAGWVVESPPPFLLSLMA